MSTNLKSPGVEVRVIDESAYNSAGQGTVPLIVFATRANKPSPDGTGVAVGTIASQANVLYKVSSQRELIQTFGDPFFVSVEGTPVHGHELNEYGLHAAYQYLGISNAAYVIRSDIDLNQLAASVAMPQSPPENGTYWFDIAESSYGVFQSTGSDSLDPFLRQQVLVISDATYFDPNNGKPLSSLGEDGSFAIVTAEGTNRIFEKVPTPAQGSVWFNVGTRSWKMARSIVKGAHPMRTLTVGDSFNINNVTMNINSTNITQVVNDLNDAIAASPILSDRSNPANPIPYVIVSNDNSGRIRFNFVLPTLKFQNVVGNPLQAMGIAENVDNKVCDLIFAPHNRVPQNTVNGDVWIKTTNPNGGANFIVKVYNEDQGQFVTIPAPLYKDDVQAQQVLGGGVVTGALYTQYNVEGSTAAPVAGFLIKRWNGRIWETLAYEQSVAQPSRMPTEGTYWYNPNFKVDIMVNDGDQWLGYRNMYPLTDPNGVILSSEKPVQQSGGDPLVENDLWIDTKDLENYPAIHRFNAQTKRWVKVDNTDQTTPFGVLFQDARENAGGAYNGAAANYERYSDRTQDMVLSNFLDPDAPNPLNYALGMLLFNTRFSTYNVKEWKPNWFDLGGFDPNEDFTASSYTVGGGFWNDNGTMKPIEFPAVTNAGRWVTASGNAVDGKPLMGRKAQRAMIVRALASTITSNEELRAELTYYNLIAAPSYPELMDEMVTLNTDKLEVAFIVGDTPARLKPTSQAIETWAKNKNNAASNGEDGLTTRSPYAGVYYPWGLTTNTDGMEIMVPPSTIALRTYAYNDQVAYPWLAPAGYNRGLVTNAASVGYLDDEGEYSPVILSIGQRDTLYLNNINPIAYIPNRGLVIYGQKTLSPLDTAMDRVNVARLINYMRYHLDNIGKPFLFEPNDQQTRDGARISVERFMMGLVGLRGVYDFAVICDESNNTPDRVDRNELWIDLLFTPAKSIEFIVIPIRIRNTGDDLVLNFNNAL